MFDSHLNIRLSFIFLCRNILVFYSSLLSLLRIALFQNAWSSVTQIANLIDIAQPS